MHKKDLILHLIGEISNFILGTDTTRMVISLRQEAEGIHLCVIDNHPRTPEDIQQISRALNSHKRPELAGYYGSMTGHDLLGGSRLNLLGWQVKNATVCPVEHGIKLDLWIGSEDFKPSQDTCSCKDS